LEDLDAFARLVTALRPWLGQLVVVGGWAHRLHRFHPLASPPEHLPLRTRDTDLAFSTDAAFAGDLRAALTAAGFTEEPFGDDAPPAAHYRLKDDDGFYAEFLTSLHGSGVKRNGALDATVSKGGINAQKMRYLDLLLVSPWSVRVGRKVGVPVTPEVDLLVPNPTTFIFQKLLIHSARPPNKKAQDALYIHDTLELFGASLEELRRLWVDVVRPAMPARTAKRAETLGRELFVQVTDTIRAAARMPQGRNLTAEAVRAACEYVLEEILRPAGARR
jgi:hypothetical protein